MKVALKSITPNAETNIVEIARVSSSRIDKTEKPEGLINYLIKNKHWSPFEMSNMVVEIETSKSIAIQLLRHRSFSFQEFSQRYAQIEGIERIEFRRQADKNRQSSTDIMLVVDIMPDTTELGYVLSLESIAAEVSQYLRDGLDLYKRLIDNGIAKECARFVLPMATTTKLYMQGSIRSWIHFLEIRCDKHTQKECREVANGIKSLFIKELPIISNALNWKDGNNNAPGDSTGKERADVSGEGESRNTIEGSRDRPEETGTHLQQIS